MADKPEDSAFKLLSSRKTLVMATADKNGAPSVSYAPFVHHAPPLYVYTSSRSRHTSAGNGEGERHVHRR
jgi:putative heme iron utilization protein